MAGDSWFSKVRLRQSNTGVGTSGVTTVTITGTAGCKLYCTGIQVSGDAACVVTIESPAATILWRKRFAAAFTISETFPPGSILSGTAAADMLVKTSASTSNAELNIQTHAITG